MSAVEPTRSGDSVVAPDPVATESISQKAARGAVVMLAGRVIRLLCNFAGLVALARFLSPADYGLIAMAAAFNGFAAILGDFGLSLSSLRSASMSVSERNALFWLNTALGTAMAVVMVVAAPSVAAFYRHEDIAMIIIVLSPVFIVNAASSQYRTDALRRGKYVSSAMSDTAAAVIGLVVGMIAAVFGAGYWTLVLQNWTVAVIGLVVIVWACRWAPGLPSRHGKLRQHLGFGWYSTLTQFVNYGSSNLNAVALGRFFGPEVVGTYSRGYQLFSLPVDQLTGPLTSIVLPLLARAERDRLPELLARLQRCLLYVVLGVCLMVAVGGGNLAIVILGERWEQAGDVVQLLMLGAVFQLCGYVYFWAFLTVGRADLQFWCEMPPRLAMAALVIFGAWYGLVGAAIAHSIGLAMCWLVSATYGARALGWSIRPLVAEAALPVILYLWAFAAGVAARTVAGNYGLAPVWCLIFSVVVTAVAVCAGLLLPVYRAHARELLHLALALRRRSANP